MEFQIRLNHGESDQLKALAHSRSYGPHVLNNAYTADLEERTAKFLMAQGMQFVAYDVPTGASFHTVLTRYFPKLYALRHLMSLFGIEGSGQIIMNPDPTSMVDIEIRIGED